MVANKKKTTDRRGKLTLDHEVYEQVREEAALQDRSIKKVGTAIVLKGLEVVRNERTQPQQAVVAN